MAGRRPGPRGSNVWRRSADELARTERELLTSTCAHCGWATAGQFKDARQAFKSHARSCPKRPPVAPPPPPPVETAPVTVPSPPATPKAEQLVEAVPARQPRERAPLKRPNAVEPSRRNGAVGLCARWNVARGRPCVCGKHTTVAA